MINLLKDYGTVLTEHIGEPTLSSLGEAKTATDIYERDMSWLRQADVVVAEVSTPSLGVGYEIGTIEHQKPVLCLYREQDGKKLSAMIAGNTSIRVDTYQTIQDVTKIFEDFFKHRQTS